LITTDLPLAERSARQFEFVDLVLLYEGGLTNARLRERFGVTNVQASRILAAYVETFPDNLARETGAGRGRYRIGPHFVSQCSDGSVWSYLRTASDGHQIGVYQPRSDLTTVHPQIFRVVRAAMTNGRGVRTFYRSMNHPAGLDRVFFPHAITFVGRRWHVRAFDREREAFVDFNLGRMRQVELTDESSPVMPIDDIEWRTQVSMRLVAHPELQPAQQRLIRDEFFQGAASRVIRCPAALVKYMVRELEVAIRTEAERPPEFQIALSNAKELESWLFPHELAKDV
jgi:predicted DNA-binding transcriptional regulator YafY